VSESPLFVGRAIAALAADPEGAAAHRLALSSELAREHASASPTTTAAVRTGGATHRLSALPPEWIDLFRTGTDLKSSG
jgi:hypothetical protein